MGSVHRQGSFQHSPHVVFQQQALSAKQPTQAGSVHGEDGGGGGGQGSLPHTPHVAQQQTSSTAQPTQEGSVHTGTTTGQGSLSHSPHSVFQQQSSSSVQPSQEGSVQQAHSPSSPSSTITNNGGSGPQSGSHPPKQPLVHNEDSSQLGHSFPTVVDKQQPQS